MTTEEIKKIIIRYLSNQDLKIRLNMCESYSPTNEDFAEQLAKHIYAYLCVDNSLDTDKK